MTKRCSGTSHFLHPWETASKVSAMFGFTLPKLIVLIAIVVAVWYGFKFVSRLDKQRKTRLKTARKTDSEPEAVGQMVKCEVCDAYVAQGAASNCGRADCPY